MGEFDYLFDTDEVFTQERIKGRFLKLEEKHEAIWLSRKKALSEDIEGLLPTEGQSLHLITSDFYGSNELLDYMIEKFTPNKIMITTWSFNQTLINNLTKYVKDGLQITFMIDRSIKGRKGSLYAQLRELQLNNSNLTVKLHDLLHSKVTILTNETDYICMEGSANYSENKRVENWIITNSRQLYDFHIDWMHKIKTNGKKEPEADHGAEK